MIMNIMSDMEKNLGISLQGQGGAMRRMGRIFEFLDPQSPALMFAHAQHSRVPSNHCRGEREAIPSLHREERVLDLL
jgi:hypothetical protein